MMTTTFPWKDGATRKSISAQVRPKAHAFERRHRLQLTSPPPSITYRIRSCGAISIHQHFEEHERRDQCDEAVREACLAARREEFRDWYEHMVFHHADAAFDPRTLPNRRDGGSMFDMAVWENEGRVPIDQDTFYGLLGDEMHVLLWDSVHNTMRRLAALVPFDLRVAATSVVLARPDALFACKECGARGLPWPEIK
ncbi:hypothetical protein GSI_03163 [Ganoderma sinense ZZ0214-1]|uniref:Uncharacterized protein n=1 Tax=Ganoderma sinense ZZ0214-1 TaxID=1077348 RepID=A0A2G8SLD3_9APHY|nr:hypothetical protein GSI_03163 [Ganoderma sinense ZZ0214-1]